MHAPGKVDRKIFGAKFCLCARQATLAFFGPAVWEEKCLHKQYAATPTHGPTFSREKETGGNVECTLFIVFFVVNVIASTTVNTDHVISHSTRHFHLRKQTDLI